MFIYHTLLGNHTYPANTTGKETWVMLLRYPWSTGKDSLKLGLIMQYPLGYT